VSAVGIIYPLVEIVERTAGGHSVLIITEDMDNANFTSIDEGARWVVTIGNIGDGRVCRLPRAALNGATFPGVFTLDYYRARGIRLGPEPIVPFPTDMGISLPNLTNISGSGPLRLSICWHRRADWLASTAVI
jgi:hypothetical protein